eukprot:3148864-Amphidinium_carterae.3
MALRRVAGNNGSACLAGLAKTPFAPLLATRLTALATLSRSLAEKDTLGSSWTARVLYNLLCAPTESRVSLTKFLAACLESESCEVRESTSTTISTGAAGAGAIASVRAL